MQPATQRQELKRLVEIYAVRTRELSVPAPPELHVAVTPERPEGDYVLLAFEQEPKRCLYCFEQVEGDPLHIPESPFPPGTLEPTPAVSGMSVEGSGDRYVRNGSSRRCALLQ